VCAVTVEIVMYLRKQQGWKNSWPASHFVLKWQGKCHWNFEMMTVAFGESCVNPSDMSQEWNVH